LHPGTAKSIDTSPRARATFHDGLFRPLVLGAADIPRVTDTSVARAEPELAVLSALAHGREEGALEVGLAGWDAAAAVAREEPIVAS